MFKELLKKVQEFEAKVDDLKAQKISQDDLKTLDLIITRNQIVNIKLERKFKLDLIVEHAKKAQANQVHEQFNKVEKALVDKAQNLKRSKLSKEITNQTLTLTYLVLCLRFLEGYSFNLFIMFINKIPNKQRIKF